ncbi:hypothetical protein QJS04_geneDACA002020 [Acorus gramineus]|uniref:F-box domain-containing protein n=1 Tax=Acorus gramineus TaxID=55184 RepID=A0AAV9A9K8_ACOGR|nr:hypothetical protein QJS04_geneDACA002020 [Acorus gramineus]
MESLTPDFTNKKSRSTMKRRRPALFQPLLLEPPPPPQGPPAPPKTTRPWSKLPLPFVKHLLRRLQIPDYIRFSSVCHAWHISKKRAQTPPSPQLPWLLLPRRVRRPSLTFYSLSEDCLYRIPTPYVTGSECVSAFRGWLLFEPNTPAMSAIPSRFIFNPLSSALHKLPNNPPPPPIIIATAIIDSPSPADPLDFLVVFASATSIYGWKPKSKDKFKKDNELGYFMLCMAAGGEKLYFITDELDLIEYHPGSDATNVLPPMSCPRHLLGRTTTS